MILLEPGNRILGETVAAQIKPPENTTNDEGVEEKGKREPIDVRLCDFDDVSYRVVIDANDKNIMNVSMNLPCYQQIKQHGADEAIQRIYGNMVIEPEAGYHITLQVKFDSLTDKEDALIQKLQLFKANVIGGVFDYYFNALLNGKSLTENFQFSLRSDTQVYFVPRPDRVIVIFSLDFQDRVDSAIARIFMQEFVEARRRLGAAPPCTFGVAPPLELKEFGITEPTGNLGFISFAVLKSHLEQNRKDKVISVLQVFRNYLQYHIKCSKSYFHSRMRARVVSLLQILNRAKFKKEGEEKQMKTIGGKTFVRS